MIDTKEITKKNLNKVVWDLVQSVGEDKIKQEKIDSKIDDLIRRYCSKEEISNLNFRKENRDWVTFFRDIKKATEAEIASFKRWIIEVKVKGLNIKYINNGIDGNSGLPILFGKKIGQPDFKVSVNGTPSVYLDIKNNTKTDNFMTFKIIELKRYVFYRSYILVCMPNSWVLLGPEFLKGIIREKNKWERSSYSRFASGKNAIRITKEQFAKLAKMEIISNYKWGDKTPYRHMDDREINYYDF